MSAFPNGIPDEDYIPLLHLLSAHMSHRNMAHLVVSTTGRDWGVAYNDALRGAAAADIPTERLNAVMNRLRQHGFDEWLRQYGLPNVQDDVPLL
jgi:hypothetical protein